MLSSRSLANSRKERLKHRRNCVRVSHKLWSLPPECGTVAKIVGYERRCIPLDAASMVLKVKVRLKYSQNHIVWLFRRVSFNIVYLIYITFRVLCPAVKTQLKVVLECECDRPYSSRGCCKRWLSEKTTWDHMTVKSFNNVVQKVKASFLKRALCQHWTAKDDEINI